MPQKFIILGAGINGLSCAYRLRQRYPEAHLEIISDRFSPETTSDVAAGLWEPFLLGDTPTELVRKWSRESYHYFHDLWKSGWADECGISLVPYVAVTAKVDGLEDPIWKDFAFGYGELSAQRLDELGREHGTKYVSGNEFVTFTCEPTRLLQFYTAALKQSTGVTFRRQKITTLQEILPVGDTNVIVINCLGLGSGRVSGDEDDTLVATRGQIRRVEAPWMFHVLISDAGYIIPNTGSVTLGGTKQKGDHDLMVRDGDSEGIASGCCGMVPGLEKAPLVGDLVGLRPTRSSVRLELEWVDGVIPVVHNYGHGGGGITLAWGCAGHVLSLVQDLSTLINGPRSKL